MNRPPTGKRPISTFLHDNAWHVLLEDGTERAAKDGEVGRLPVSGKTTRILQQAILDRAELRRTVGLFLSFLDSLPEGWLGKTVGDIALLNDAYCSKGAKMGVRL